MDPEACLLAAETCLKDMEFDLFTDCMSEYVEWRKKGGFEPAIPSCYENSPPIKGDVFFGTLRTRWGVLMGHTNDIPNL